MATTWNYQPVIHIRLEIRFLDGICCVCWLIFAFSSSAPFTPSGRGTSSFSLCGVGAGATTVGSSSSPGPEAWFRTWYNRFELMLHSAAKHPRCIQPTVVGFKAQLRLVPFFGLKSGTCCMGVVVPAFRECCPGGYDISFAVAMVHTFMGSSKQFMRALCWTRMYKLGRGEFWVLLSGALSAFWWEAIQIKAMTNWASINLGLWKRSSLFHP